jgi:hypothetical protein
MREACLGLASVALVTGTGEMPHIWSLTDEGGRAGPGWDWRMPHTGVYLWGMTGEGGLLDLDWSRGGWT